MNLRIQTVVLALLRLTLAVSVLFYLYRIILPSQEDYIHKNFSIELLVYTLLIVGIFGILPNLKNRLVKGKIFIWLILGGIIFCFDGLLVYWDIKGVDIQLKGQVEILSLTLFIGLLFIFPVRERILGTHNYSIERTSKFFNLVTLYKENEHKIHIRLQVIFFIFFIFYNAAWLLVQQEGFSKTILPFYLGMSYVLLFLGLFLINPVRGWLVRAGNYIVQNINWTLQENERENRKRLARERKFTSKFSAMARVPILRTVLLNFYREGWIYSSTVVALIWAGFALRLHRLGALSLWWDEGITGLVVKQIIETGTPFAGEIFYWRGVAYHYFVAGFTYIFGHDEFWIRFPSVLFGMGIVLLSFWYAKKINKWVGLLVLIFLTFSTYNIAYSQFARFYIMNAFLFMLAGYTVYQGFFKDKRKYKILSILIYSVMLMTVQLGSLFLSFLGVWGLTFVFEIMKKKKNLLSTLKANISNFLYVGLAFVLFIIQNPFEKYLQKDATYARRILEGVPSHDYPIYQLPQWKLFAFFNDHHIPIVLFFTAALILGFTWWSKKIDSKKFSFASYLFWSLIVSVIMYEVGSRDVYGARIYHFAEAFYVIFSLFAVFFLAKLLTKKILLQKAISLFIVLLIIFWTKPFFYERISQQYGDNVSMDPFRSTTVAAYRADYKTQFVYLKEQMEAGDIWINVGSAYSFIMDRPPDYTLNQSSSWYKSVLINENGKYVNRDGTQVITSVEDIENIIRSNTRSNTWLVVNGGSINIINTVHVKDEFLQFINEYPQNVVFESQDGYSKVYRF